MRPQTLAGYRLYRFYDATGALLYVGQTGRMPMQRAAEHLREQPWAHEIATFQLDPRVWSSVDEVCDAERRAIRTEQPRYNVVHNGRNPHRVRAARVPRQRAAYRPAPLPRWWRPVAFGLLWLLVAGGAGGAAIGGGAKVGNSLVFGALLGAVVVVQVARRRPRRRRR